MKRKLLSALLCVCLIAASAVPAMAQNSSYYVRACAPCVYDDESIRDDARIEVGIQNFNVGDLAIFSKENAASSSKNYALSTSKDAVYSSSNPSVISVASNGLLTVKKTGEATISMKHKKDASGVTLYIHFKAVEKGSFDYLRKECVKASDAAAKLISASKKKLTSKNASLVFNAYKNYSTYASAEEKNSDWIFYTLSAGISDVREYVVSGKSRKDASLQAPKKYIKSALTPSWQNAQLGTSYTSYKLYQLDSSTYKVVPSYIGKPAVDVIVDINDGSKSEIISGTGKYGTFDPSTQTLKINTPYITAVDAHFGDNEHPSIMAECPMENWYVENYTAFWSGKNLRALCAATNDPFIAWDPFDAFGKNAFKIKSASLKGSTGTITLKNKVSAQQIIGANIVEKNKVSSKDVKIPVYALFGGFAHGYFMDDRVDIIKGTATIKKGSSKISIQFNKKLKKGCTYVLSPMPNFTKDWIIKSSDQYVEAIAK